MLLDCKGQEIQSDTMDNFLSFVSFSVSRTYTAHGGSWEMCITLEMLPSRGHIDWFHITVEVLSTRPIKGVNKKQQSKTEINTDT